MKSKTNLVVRSFTGVREHLRGDAMLQGLFRLWLIAFIATILARLLLWMAGPRMDGVPVPLQILAWAVLFIAGGVLYLTPLTALWVFTSRCFSRQALAPVPVRHGRK